MHRKVRDAALADDLLQEVFMRVHVHLARLRAPERVAPWLYRIARNLAVDHLRRPTVQADPVAETVVWLEDAGAATPRPGDRPLLRGSVRPQRPRHRHPAASAARARALLRAVFVRPSGRRSHVLSGSSWGWATKR
ncbi:MAG: hypothetical protein JNK56_23645 [Myxococcales bacterium]|nr:hypothetical protein [Myxococcales bacterium]